MSSSRRERGGTGPALALLANNGDMGGGEVMLLAMARAAHERGCPVVVVAPSAPDGIVAAASAAGLAAVSLVADRRGYMRELRRWAKGRPQVMWCNGLVPSMALAGRPRRVVHLHRAPRGAQIAATWVARQGALATVVPSAFMARLLPGATVLENWTALPAQARAEGPLTSGDPPSPRTPPATGARPIRIGFLGRWAHEKGLAVLIDAAQSLGRTKPVELVIAGAPRFHVDADIAEIRAALDRSSVPVHQLGWVSREALFAAVDVLVVPSCSPESFGLVAAEAMAANMPVIVTDAGGLPEVVGPAHPWVARADDVDSLATVLGSFHETPLDRRAEITQQAHERWLELYSPTAGTSRFLALVDRLSETAGPSSRAASRSTS